MRFRNFIPLLLLWLCSFPLGVLFLFVWQEHAGVLCGMQCFNVLFLVLTYRAGINSAKKNITPPLEPGKIIYLPLKVNLALYLLAGIPVIVIFAENLTVLVCGFGASLVGFSLSYISGLTYLARSTPAKP